MTIEIPTISDVDGDPIDEWYKIFLSLANQKSVRSNSQLPSVAYFAGRRSQVLQVTSELHNGDFSPLAAIFTDGLLIEVPH